MLEVEIDISAPDPTECPANVTELFSLLDSSITGTVLGDFLPYVTGTATPGSEDQDKVWHRLDTNEKPIGTFLYYHGRWVREYQVPVGFMGMYSGDPDFDFDSTGLGRVEGDSGSTGEYDGWHLCNGQGGTEDLSDKFIVGGKRYVANQWETDVSGAATHSGVGVHEIQLDADNTYRPATAAITIGRWDADGNTPNGAGGLFGLGSDTTLSIGDAGNPTPPAIPTLPPYLTCAFIIFVGYTT